MIVLFMVVFYHLMYRSDVSCKCSHFFKDVSFSTIVFGLDVTEDFLPFLVFYKIF